MKDRAKNIVDQPEMRIAEIEREEIELDRQASSSQEGRR